MTNRIFRAIFLVAAAVMLAVSLLTMGMMYQFSAEETTEKLQRETEYIACGIETDGVRYLEKIKDADTRITWVDADGTVLYDSSADASKMENHSDREEIKEAMQSGEGNSKRISATLSGQTLPEVALQLGDLLLGIFLDGIIQRDSLAGKGILHRDRSFRVGEIGDLSPFY